MSVLPKLAGGPRSTPFIAHATVLAVGAREVGEIGMNTRIGRGASEAALFIAATLLCAISCSSKDSDSSDGGSSGSCNIARHVPCDCADGSVATQRIDGCTDEPLGECECLESRSCQTPIGCPGEASCRGDDCDPCTCDLEQIRVEGDARLLSIGPDGTRYVLLNEAPWLYRFGPDADAGEPLQVQSDLSWVNDFVLAADGSIILVGSVEDSTEGVNVLQIQRLDASGALVGSTRWVLESGLSGEPDDGVLAGLALRSDGSVIVAGIAFASLHIGAVTDDTQVELLSTSEIYEGVTVGEDVLGSRKPTDYAQSGDRLFLTGHVVDSGRVDGIWTAVVGADNAVSAHWATSDYDLYGPDPAISVNAAGDIYQGWSWSFTDRTPRAGYVARSPAELGTIWLEEFQSETEDTKLHDVAALADSVLVFSSRSENVTLGRLSKNHTPGEPFPAVSLLGLPIDIELEGQFGVHVLSAGSTTGSYYLTHYELESIGVSALAAGEACASNSECSSTRCCQLGGPGAGTCSDSPACPADSRCTSDEDCSGGACWTGAAATSGICTQTCEASADCPPSYFCATPPCEAETCPQLCLADCLAGGTTRCTDIDPGLACNEIDNAEAVSVSVCH